MPLRAKSDVFLSCVDEVLYNLGCVGTSWQVAIQILDVNAAVVVDPFPCWNDSACNMSFVLGL
jgi:hypothetical protein